MVVKCKVNVQGIPDLRIITEAYNIVCMELFERAISNRPDYHDTRGCNGKYFYELFGNGDGV